MRGPWSYVRSWFARVGSDPYYASYERSLSNIQTEIDRLQAVRAARHRAWAHIRARFMGGFAAAYAVILAYASYVNQQPAGTYTNKQHAVRVAPALAGAPAGWLLYRLLRWLQALLDRRADARVRLLQNKQRKQVAELKDSTRYDRTLALLQKYDPDYKPTKPQLPTPAARGRGGAALQQQQGGVPAPVSRVAGAAANAAGSALQGAGARMFPVLAQLYSRAAGTLIADDPVMLGLLREAQQQSDALRHRLMQAESQAVALLQDNIQLKQQLGLPAEEEQAALAALMGAAQGGGGGTAAEGRDTTPEQQQQQQVEGHEETPKEGGEAAEPAATDSPVPQRVAAEGTGPSDAPQSAGGASRISRKKRGSGN